MAGPQHISFCSCVTLRARSVASLSFPLGLMLSPRHCGRWLLDPQLALRLARQAMTRTQSSQWRMWACIGRYGLLISLMVRTATTALVLVPLRRWQRSLAQALVRIGWPQARAELQAPRWSVEFRQHGPWGSVAGSTGGHELLLLGNAGCSRAQLAQKWQMVVCGGGGRGEQAGCALGEGEPARVGGGALGHYGPPSPSA